MKNLFLIIALSFVVNVVSAQSNQRRTVTSKTPQTTVRKSAPRTQGQTARKTTAKPSGNNTTAARPATGKKSKLIFCPDNKHPHAIDLGLSSETLWACCNVGAIVPEDFGGLYAIGELKEKKKYGSFNYKFCDENGRYYPPRDIIGTENDVAHVKWGKGWQMPSLSQFKELIESCTFEAITVDTIQGAKLTGPNGNSIFLPAAGNGTGNGREHIGTGSYSQGEANGSYIREGYWQYISFDKDNGIKVIRSIVQLFGHSVRPIIDER